MDSKVVDRVAESIWQAEWSRARNGGARKVPWSDVAEADQNRYRYTARAAILTYLNIALSEVS